MKKTLKHALISLGVVLLAQGAAAGGDAAAGEAKSATCVACHGPDGNSPAPSFPKIANLGEKNLYKQLRDIQSGRRNIVEMTGLLDNSSDQDLQDMAAFFDSQPMQLSGARDIKVRLGSGLETDALALGERIYRAGNLETGVPACSGCHSPTGKGNAPAGYPRLGGQYAEYTEKQLRAFRGGERTNDGDQQTMLQIAEHMTDAEIIAVANYIAGLN